ncbi:response regulator [Cohnella caldifontis]|uniref:response regulator n=1 Tax=Cohnella caldifontis TaxID=3027471 RepID=UPI0023EC7AAC|nr:response regulator [Cohnella sp. YIM B05605]
MFRILIVDDEPSVVDAIAQTLPWSELDIDEVFCAYSAKEALAWADRQYVDIVLTDIRMPGMDGLQLLHQLRDRNKRTRFILLTGHAEFQYAKEALRLQVVDYLLKPVRDEALIDIIGKAAASLKEEWAQISSQQRTLDYLREHLPALRAELLREALEGKTAGRELAEKADMLDLPYRAGDTVYPVIVRLEHYFPHARERALLEYAVLNIAQEVLGEAFEVWGGNDVYDFQVLLLKLKEAAAAEDGQELVSRLAGQVQHLVLHYLNKNISVVCGRSAEFTGDLPSSYEAAVRTMRRWIGGDTGLLLSSDPAEPAAVSRSLSSLQSPPSLAHLFEAGLWEEARNRLQAIFEELEAWGEAPIHADALAEIYHTILSACFHYAHSSGQTIARALDCESDPKFYQSIELTQSAAALQAWAMEACRRLSASSRDETLDARAGLIKQVKEYIHVHLGDDVSLQTLAGHVGMHPVYLSKVYKLETGEALKDYLHRVRMERALHLLRHSDLKIYEIAGQIGYLNTAYFIKTFKKEHGVTPQEYRDRL